MVSKTAKYWIGGIAGVIVVGIAATYAVGSNPIMIGAAFMNEFRGAGAPDGAINVELREAATPQPFAPHRMASAPAITDPGDDWVAYNRTVYGDRYSPLTQINVDNASQLKKVCSYDSNKLEGFQVSPIEIQGTIIATTAEDIFAIDATNCKEKWRSHENSGIGFMPVNRGVALMNGKVIRGYPDGFIRAYDVQAGKKIWETFIGDKDNKLWFTSAPTAWNGMVFYGTAGGDIYNVRGRVYGLNADTGAVVWQTFTVPQQAEDPVYGKLGVVPAAEMKTTWQNDPDVPITGGGVWTSITVDPTTGNIYIPIGNPAPDFVQQLRLGENLFTNTMLILNAKTGDYVKHYSIMKHDWQDWDMSNPPIFYTTQGGKDVFSFHPKDGHAYSYDVASGQQLFRNPVTKIENPDVTFEPEKEYHFCPGAVGGGESSSAAFDPSNNLLFTGQNEWCATAKIKPIDKAAKKADGGVWFGSAYYSPYNWEGKFVSKDVWGGWIYATDADTGQWKWRARANFPTVSGMTPTAGGILAFGDMGGNFRVLKASDGTVLYDEPFNGGIAGGVITYAVKGKQYFAFTSGTAHPQWPVEPDTGKIVVLGL